MNFGVLNQILKEITCKSQLAREIFIIKLQKDLLHISNIFYVCYRFIFIILTLIGIRVLTYE